MKHAALSLTVWCVMTGGLALAVCVGAARELRRVWR